MSVTVGAILIGFFAWVCFHVGRAWEMAKQEIAAKKRGLFAECAICKARFIRAANEPEWAKDWCVRCLRSVLSRTSLKTN